MAGEGTGKRGFRVIIGSDETDLAQRELGEKVTGEAFSCIAGKTALRRGTTVHRHYGILATAAATEALHADLADFARRKDDIDPLLASFVATFGGPMDSSEEEFEALLWTQLQRLHDLDATRHAWSGLVDQNPMSRTFGFSVGGHPFFVVGMHSGASRITRRFGRPALAFNSHVQFERLKERGIYQRLQRQIRAREMALQGSLNPNLAEFGEKSEAAQYSGRAVGPDWVCPFRPHLAGPAAVTNRADFRAAGEAAEEKATEEMARTEVSG